MVVATGVAYYYRPTRGLRGLCLTLAVVAMHITIAIVVVATTFTYPGHWHGPAADERVYTLVLAGPAVAALMLCTRVLLARMTYHVRTAVLVVVLGMDVLCILLLIVSASAEAHWLAMILAGIASQLATL